MQNKRDSFDQIFTAIRSFGVSDLMILWGSRLFGKQPDISGLIKLVSKNSELLVRNRSFVLINDIKTMKNIYVSPQYENITGFQIEDFNLSFFVSHYCQADGANGLIIHDMINNHQKETDVLDKHLYLYASTFRYLNARGYYTWMYSRMMIIHHDEQNLPSLGFSMVTEMEPFKKDESLTFSRMKYNPISENYENESFEEFLPDGIYLLTKTDLKILEHLSNGLDNSDIANQMGLSEHTIRDYRKKMLQKTWCSNMCELITFALRNKLI